MFKLIFLFILAYYLYFCVFNYIPDVYYNLETTYEKR